MDFEQFKEEMAKKIKETLDSKYGMETSVDVRTVEKMNESYEAITVKPEGSIIGVNLNANELFKEYEQGKSIDCIASTAAEFANRSLHSGPDFDIDSFNDYGKMKEKLTMEVVSSERNADLLQKVPHKDIEDMSVVYRFELTQTDEEQLHVDTLSNAQEFKPIVIESMANVLAKQMGIEDVDVLGLGNLPKEEQTYVASVEGYVNGAGVIAYQDFMEKASERVGNSSFFILPSSIHELLIIPDNGKFDLQELKNMVKEVNTTTVDPADKLTDSVYHYDAKDKIFELGEKFVECQSTKEVKKSLSAEIKAKKEEIAKAPKKEAPGKEPKAKEGKVK